MLKHHGMFRAFGQLRSTARREDLLRTAWSRRIRINDVLPVGANITTRADGSSRLPKQAAADDITGSRSQISLETRQDPKLQLHQRYITAMASHTHPSDSKIEEIISSTDSHSQQIDQIATDRKWFRPLEDSNFYPTVQNFVYGKINAEEASAKLFGPIDDAITSERLDDVNFGDLWYSIIHSARRISHHERELHERVVDLVSAFKHHSVPNNEKYDYLYQSLPDFGMSCREAYNDAPQLDKGFSQIEVDAWANLNFFFSLITARELEDLSLYAIWAMRQALEDVPQDEPRHSAAQSYDTYIPAAAVWIIGLGSTLFRLEKDLTPTDRKQGNPARGGELWKGKAEFSKERWALWKERFAAIGKMEEVNDKTKSMGRDAVEHMERAETFEPI